MTTDLIYIYRTILEAQGIQFILLNDNFDNLNQMDFGFRSALFNDFDYSSIQSHFKRAFRNDSVLLIHDRLELDYCVFQFPEPFKTEYKATYGLIGPVNFEPVTPWELKKTMRENNIPDAFFQTFMEFHNRIPSLPSMDFWFSLVRPLLNEIFGTSLSYRYTKNIDSLQKEFKAPVSPDSGEFHDIEDRYYVEQQMLDAVAKGDKEKALDWYRKFKNFKFLPRAADNVRNQKNLLLTLNTLLRKAIQVSGIHPIYIDQISRDFAVSIEFASNAKELETMPATMIRKYCILVHNHNYQSYSPPIERCLQYIEFYYAQPLTLDLLAKHCYVTSNYLSSLFKKETGITLREYINQIRIQHSILLLNTTHLSIQEIAARCGFPDANYFSRIFKKLNGITPLSYRKKISK